MKGWRGWWCLGGWLGGWRSVGRVGGWLGEQVAGWLGGCVHDWVVCHCWHKLLQVGGWVGFRWALGCTGVRVHEKTVEICMIVWVEGWEGMCLGGCLSEWWVAGGLGECVAGGWPSRWGGSVGGQTCEWAGERSCAVISTLGQGILTSPFLSFSFLFC